MVLDASLLNTQHYKVRIKGKVEQSRERSRALPTPWCSKLLKREPSGYPRLWSPTLLTIKWSVYFFSFQKGYFYDIISFFLLLWLIYSFKNNIFMVSSHICSYCDCFPFPKSSIFFFQEAYSYANTYLLALRQLSSAKKRIIIIPLFFLFVLRVISFSQTLFPFISPLIYSSMTLFLFKKAYPIITYLLVLRIFSFFKKHITILPPTINPSCDSFLLLKSILLWHHHLFTRLAKSFPLLKSIFLWYHLLFTLPSILTLFQKAYSDGITFYLLFLQFLHFSKKHIPTVSLPIYPNNDASRLPKTTFLFYHRLFTLLSTPFFSQKTYFYYITSYFLVLRLFPSSIKNISISSFPIYSSCDLFPLSETIFQNYPLLFTLFSHFLFPRKIFLRY